MKFLFLASHGLLSPIAGIRWGCGRLRRTDTQNLSEEQKKLLEHVYTNAKRLSKVFGSMILLARNEDGTYVPREETITLSDMLETDARDRDGGAELTVTVECDADLAVRCDRPLLETVIQDVASVIGEAAAEPRTLAVRAVAEGDRVAVSFESALELSFLQSVQSGSAKPEVRMVVGGTPGLLLSLSNALAGFMGGSVEMTESPRKTYLITVRLPQA